MNEVKQLQMRLTSDHKLVCDSNPTVIFCDGKYPHKDKPVLTFEQRDVVYLTDYEGWTSQYEEAMKIVKERRCCAIVTDNPMLLNVLAPYVWNGEDFSRYAKTLQTFLVQDLLKIASFPIQFKFKKSLYDNIRSNSYYNKVLTYRTSHIVIGLFKLKFDKSIVLLARIRNFISSIYHKI